MTNAKAIDSPLPLSHTLHIEKTKKTDEDLTSMRDIHFREMFGSLPFLATRTRSDLATEFSILGKFQQALLVLH